ncbi:MAG: SDR family oxidoreductase [Deltaproteobacteria bacterium]|nr:SDR family oxidoreductase [Deltaproteobacteria bacterium]
MQAFRAAIPLSRPGTPDEAARALLFLASPLSDYVSGHVLEVTGDCDGARCRRRLLPLAASPPSTASGPQPPRAGRPVRKLLLLCVWHDM